MSKDTFFITIQNKDADQKVRDILTQKGIEADTDFSLGNNRTLLTVCAKESMLDEIKVIEGVSIVKDFEVGLIDDGDDEWV